MAQYKALLLLLILWASLAYFQLSVQESNIPTDQITYPWIFSELANITTPDLQGDDVLHWGSSLGPYYNSTETVARLHMTASAFPELVTYFEIGYSFEGKPLAGIKITDSSVIGPKYETVVVGAHHAREVITVVDALIFIDRLLFDYLNNDSWATLLLAEAEVYVLPLLNPDGVDFTYRNPWQRKNMQIIDDDGDNNTDDQYEVADVNGDYYIGSFYNSTLGYETLEAIDGPDADTDAGEDSPGGIDLNRNYGYKFAYDDIGSSSDTRNDAYRGPFAFSAPETAAWKSFAESHHFYTSLSLHSGIQAMITPWGWTSTPSADNELFKTIENEAIGITGFPTWEDSAGYNVNGEWGDWMYGELDSLAFTIEAYGNSQAFKYLPYKNTYYSAGIWDYFNPAANQIYQTSTEGVQIMIDYVVAQPLYSSTAYFTNLEKKFSASIISLNTITNKIYVDWKGNITGTDVFLALEVENTTTLGWSAVARQDLSIGTTFANISYVLSENSTYRLYLGSTSRGYTYPLSLPDVPTTFSAVAKRGIELSYTMPLSSVSFTASTLSSISSSTTSSSTTSSSTKTSSTTSETHLNSSEKPTKSTVFYPMVSAIITLFFTLYRRKLQKSHI